MVSGNDAVKPSSSFVVTKALVRWCLYTAMGWYLLSVDPFGLGSFAEEGSQQVIYELGGPLYDTEAREDITIVLVSEQSLKALYERKISATNEWPLLYQDWATILKTLAAHSPRAIFVDVLFEQERVTDSSLPLLFSALRRLETQTPVYFAGGLPPYESELLRRLDDRADLGGSAWQGFGNGVPLFQSGEALASVKLYRDACGREFDPLPGCVGEASWLKDVSDSSPAMSLVWGGRGTLPLTAELEGRTSNAFCSNNTASFKDIFFSVVKSGLGDFAPDFLSKDGSQCLFHRVIDVDELFYVFDHGTESEKEVLQTALEDKLVLIGTWFDGLPDAVNTPTMGQIPGVALHAMMLDNLMTFGPNYVRTAGDRSVNYNLAVWAFIVLILVAWMGYRERYESAEDATTGFIGRDSTRFLVVSLGLTFIAALFTLFVLRFEPANAIGFLGLAELTRRINAKWEDDLFQKIRYWVRKMSIKGSQKI